MKLHTPWVTCQYQDCHCKRKGEEMGHIETRRDSMYVPKEVRPLILAAPDLLKIAERLVKNGCNPDVCTGGIRRPCDCGVNEARDILAKIGEAPGK